MIANRNSLVVGPIERGISVLGEMELDLVGGIDFPGEVFEDRFAVRKSDGGDPLGAGALYVISVLEAVILDEENEGLQSIEISLLGAVSGLNGAGEIVVCAETDFIAGFRDFVELPADCEVTQRRQRIHSDDFRIRMFKVMRRIMKLGAGK